VHMIKLTETHEITPYKWAHPNEERRACNLAPRFGRRQMFPEFDRAAWLASRRHGQRF
jgi:predicted NUDIX family NTP pyrophosphohydrolase